MKLDVTKIEVLLARQDLTLSEWGIRAGLPKQYLSVVKNRGTCMPKTAQKLADGLGVDVTEIMETEA